MFEKQKCLVQILSEPMKHWVEVSRYTNQMFYIFTEKVFFFFFFNHDQALTPKLMEEGVGE